MAASPPPGRPAQERAVSLRRPVAGAALVIVLGAAGVAFAHKPSESTLALHLRGDGDGTGDGRWQIAVRDLDDALALDANGDGAVTWGELRAAEAVVAAAARDALTLTSDRGPCGIAIEPI